MEWLADWLEFFFAPLWSLLQLVIDGIGRIAYFVYSACQDFFCWLCNSLLDVFAAVVDQLILMFPSMFHGFGDYRAGDSVMGSFFAICVAVNNWVPAFETFEVVLIFLVARGTLIGIRWLITFIPGVGV